MNATDLMPAYTSEAVQTSHDEFGKAAGVGDIRDIRGGIYLPMGGFIIKVFAMSFSIWNAPMRLPVAPAGNIRYYFRPSAQLYHQLSWTEHVGRWIHGCQRKRMHAK